MTGILIVADASTFSAVHSDVSYAGPDTGYAWSETDTSEYTGKLAHLLLKQPNRTVWSTMPSLY